MKILIYFFIFEATQETAHVSLQLFHSPRDRSLNLGIKTSIEFLVGSLGVKLSQFNLWREKQSSSSRRPSMEIVLWLLMFAVMTVRYIHVCWKDTHWSMNMGTNRKATSKHVCLP